MTSSAFPLVLTSLNNFGAGSQSSVPPQCNHILVSGWEQRSCYSRFRSNVLVVGSEVVHRWS